MKTPIIIILLFCCFVVTGCGGVSPATFKVVDEQTGQPIEGAVAVAYTIKRSGFPGLRYGEFNEVVERTSNAEGVFEMPKFSNVPRLLVYKPGYIVWYSRYIYLGCYEGDYTLDRFDYRTGYRYGSQTLSLKNWDQLEVASHVSHDQFITGALPSGPVSNFKKALREHELPLIMQERQTKGGKLVK